MVNIFTLNMYIRREKTMDIAARIRPYIQPFLRIIGKDVFMGFVFG